MRPITYGAIILGCLIVIPTIVNTQTTFFQYGDARHDHAWFQLTDPSAESKVVGAFFDGTQFELNPTVRIATVSGADSDVQSIFQAHSVGIQGAIARVLNASLGNSGQSVRVECLRGISIGQLQDGYRELPLRDGAEVVVNSFSVDSVTLHSADKSGNNVQASLNVDALASAVRSLTGHSFPVKNSAGPVASPSVSTTTGPIPPCPSAAPSQGPSSAAKEGVQAQPASKKPSPGPKVGASHPPSRRPVRVRVRRRFLYHLVRKQMKRPLGI
jgi:hypothetical protein